MKRTCSVYLIYAKDVNGEKFKIISFTVFPDRIPIPHYILPGHPLLMNSRKLFNTRDEMIEYCMDLLEQNNYKVSYEKHYDCHIYNRFIYLDITRPNLDPDFLVITPIIDEG